MNLSNEGWHNDDSEDAPRRIQAMLPFETVVRAAGHTAVESLLGARPAMPDAPEMGSLSRQNTMRPQQPIVADVVSDGPYYHSSDNSERYEYKKVHKQAIAAGKNVRVHGQNQGKFYTISKTNRKRQFSTKFRGTLFCLKYTLSSKMRQPFSGVDVVGRCYRREYFLFS